MIYKGNKKKRIVESSVRVQLIRKGNQFLSEGMIKAAERIFTAVDYKDGLVRLGDYYLNSNNIYKAAEMYFASENPQKIEAFSKRAAAILKKWLDDDLVYDKILIDKNKG